MIEYRVYHYDLGVADKRRGDAKAALFPHAQRARRLILYVLKPEQINCLRDLPCQLFTLDTHRHSNELNVLVRADVTEISHVGARKSYRFL